MALLYWKNFHAPKLAGLAIMCMWAISKQHQPSYVLNLFSLC